MPAKIYDEPMSRRNMHLPDKQFERMKKLAHREGLSVSALYRAAADALIAEKVAIIKQQREESA